MTDGEPRGAAARTAATATTERRGTILDRFEQQVRDRDAAPALRRWNGSTYEIVSWQTYGHLVETTAAGLHDLGVRAGDRVGVLAANRVEWHVADLGVVRDALPELPELRHVIAIDGEAPSSTDAVSADGDASGRTVGFGSVLERGRRALADDPSLIRRARAAIAPEQVATIVYTSGTTGEPKGAELTHANLTATIAAIEAVVPIGPDDRFFSFLPLSHIAERIVSHFGHIQAGGETWFARSFASAGEDLQRCRPTVFFAVPRVWEKARAGVTDKLGDAPSPMRRLAFTYLSLGRRMVEADQRGVEAPAWARASHRALDAVVGKKIRHGLGLDAARVVVSGAAPIHREVLEWFHAVGLQIAEVYGQTEDCGPATLNPPGAVHIGTVGRPLPGVEVMIAADDEILVRGPTVCRGYFRNEVATRELIDDEGWMHTGDLGRLDDDGYLTITGRKKDLIVTAHGKNIAPQHIETLLRTIPLVSQAVVLGDARPFVTALLTLDPDIAVPWAHARGKTPAPEALAADPDVHDELRRGVEAVNAELNSVEQVKRWRVLPRDLTLADGELTPTLKVKRDVVLDHRREVVEAMYTDDR